MAKFYGPGGNVIARSETIVGNALKLLSDDWTIFHSVTWQAKRLGRQGDGEADFIVLHPSKGILIIEVKGGGIDIEDGQWYTTNRDNQRFSIKNPYDQAMESKHALVRWLQDRNLHSKILVGHAVAFPNMQRFTPVGMNASREITFTQDKLDEIEKSIFDCFKYWGLKGSLSVTEAKTLATSLAPTVVIAPALSYLSSTVEKSIVRLTDEQIAVFSGLRSTRGGLVIGGAGTGKTILAIARAKQLASDGFRTLLLCYNELLGKHLADAVGDNSDVVACTFHSLCLHEAAKAKLRISSDRDSIWWENESPNMLIDACVSNETNYDAVVIDEGQDFSAKWMDAIRCIFSRKLDAPLYVFADPLQDLWSRNWMLETDYPFSMELRKNLRNSFPIARRVAATMEISYEFTDIEGPDPIWITTKRIPCESDILSVVERLTREGFGPGNLVVLCCDHRLVTRIRERSVADYSFGEFGSHGIAVETISRFKGLEAQAIILVLNTIEEKVDLIEAYVGMSRARSILAVIGTEREQSKLRWNHLKS